MFCCLCSKERLEDELFYTFQDLGPLCGTCNDHHKKKFIQEYIDQHHLEPLLSDEEKQNLINMDSAYFKKISIPDTIQAIKFDFYLQILCILRIINKRIY
jgi:hypothetical protein